MYEQIQHTIEEMFLDRGYENIKKIPLADADFNLMAKAKHNTSDIWVFYTNQKIGKNELLKFFNDDYKTKHIMVVSQEELTSYAKLVLTEKQKEGFKIEFFLAKQLMFNISKHVFQPSFRLLSKEETETLLKQLQCKLLQLNKISRNDPMVRYYDAQPKQVFEIKRDTLRGDRHDRGITFRVVV